MINYLLSTLISIGMGVMACIQFCGVVRRRLTTVILLSSISLIFFAACGNNDEVPTPEEIIITPTEDEDSQDEDDDKSQPEKTAAQPDIVDLGLSVKWASFNLGATKPEEFGWYLAWGETEEKDKYDWDTYLKGLGGSMTSFEDAGTDKDPLREYVNNGTKYYETISGSEYDAAHVYLGNSWRMPTIDEYAELVWDCTWEWKAPDNQEFSGIPGFKVISNKKGYENAFIFLPSGGGRGENFFFGSTGCTGYYRSVSIDRSFGGAYVINFDSNSIPYPYVSFPRYLGLLIRPVTDLTAEDKARNFRNTYSEVLTLTVETVTSDDRIMILEAINAYSKLDPSVQELLSYEKKLFDALKDIVVYLPDGVKFVQLWANGPKWANMNIGATTETDNGDYFWWGDIEGHAKNEDPKFYFNDDNAVITSWRNNEDYVTDGKLVAENDAATQRWGAGYRMPTQAEFADLYNNCVWTWHTNYNGVDNANGYLITGKGDYAGNSIFLPAASCRYGEDLYGEGSNGYYWSSTPYPDYADCFAYNLYFRSDNVFPDYYDGRDNGFPVRPVSEL